MTKNISPDLILCSPYLGMFSDSVSMTISMTEGGSEYLDFPPLSAKSSWIQADRFSPS